MFSICISFLFISFRIYLRCISYLLFIINIIIEMLPLLLFQINISASCRNIKSVIYEVNYTVFNFSFYFSDNFFCSEPLRSFFFIYLFFHFFLILLSNVTGFLIKKIFFIFYGQHDIFLFLTCSHLKTIQIIVISFHIIFHSIIFLFRNYGIFPFPF